MNGAVVPCLAERLDRLERAHRCWKLVSGATILLFLSAIGFGAAAPRSPQPTPEVSPMGSG